jgi:hypothetical protein
LGAGVIKLRKGIPPRRSKEPEPGDQKKRGQKADGGSLFLTSHRPLLNKKDGREEEEEILGEDNLRERCWSKMGQKQVGG